MTKFDIKKYKSLSVLFWNNMQKTSSKIHYVNFCYMQFIHGGMSRKFMHTTIHYFGGRGEKSALWFKIACWRRPKIDEYLVISIDSDFWVIFNQCMPFGRESIIIIFGSYTYMFGQKVDLHPRILYAYNRKIKAHACPKRYLLVDKIIRI